MKTSSSLLSRPLFPDWIFEGKLPVPKSNLHDLVCEAQSLPSTSVYYGRETVPNRQSKVTGNFTKMVGGIFYNTAHAHFQLGPEWASMECTEVQFTTILPGMSTEATVARQRWYQCLAVLDVKGPCMLKLHLFGAKQYATPPGVQETSEIIKLSPGQIWFWPAHIPWTIQNRSEHVAAFMQCSIVLKKA